MAIIQVKADHYLVNKPILKDKIQKFDEERGAQALPTSEAPIKPLQKEDRKEKEVEVLSIIISSTTYGKRIK